MISNRYVEHSGEHAVDPNHHRCTLRSFRDLSRPGVIAADGAGRPRTHLSDPLLHVTVCDRIETLLRVWPVPEGHHGKVVDPQTKAGD